VQTILIIDDDPMVRRTLYFVLRSKGFEVIEAENGQAGIELARDKSPDLILSDISMNQPDGYAVLEALKQDPRTSNIPFLFLTGLVDQAKMQLSMEQGAVACLEKPFSVETLIQVVHKHLGKGKPSPQNLA
jgi:CheY-like chemotaxis protein